ncbi:DUF2098 domain-containing protein [Methanolobus halotolerans]|uniref:DUF2098 domain-containing protein n=1 Tax=Methanolobus halotolerans TaxID=2052935 RepID=A0A4E0PWM0_9EURY|nr:DUF2098 domain-containing protein [Methanolobus halotolerans]
MNGDPVGPGTVVRYINTGTVGKVTEIKTDEEGIWALMDSTGLYYKVETLVVTDASELKVKAETAKTASEAEEYMRRYGSAGPDQVDIGQVTGGG